MAQYGKFVISLDFELMWGVFDKKTISSYGSNIIGAREVIPKMLDLFEDFNIGVTWATVGCLFFDNKVDLLNSFPVPDFNYENKKLSAHTYSKQIGLDEKSDPYHYAQSIVKLISSYPRQELATHTFSHFYCLEKGPSIDMFESDIVAAKYAANLLGIEIQSIVFPRNQYHDEIIKKCIDLNLSAYRGNYPNWLYNPRSGEKESIIRRVIRLTDSYFNLSGHLCFDLKSQHKILNIPASAFLRPFNKKLKFLEPLKLQRIKNCMSYAAKNKLMYHLWWHPHNFGANQSENLAMLKSILVYYAQLNTQYDFKNYTMNELSNEISLSCQTK